MFVSNVKYVVAPITCVLPNCVKWKFEPPDKLIDGITVNENLLPDGPLIVGDLSSGVRFFLKALSNICLLMPSAVENN